MEIRKVYDVETLKNKLQESIEEARKNSTTRVKVDILTAQEVLEVLEETYKREQKHQTLESALTFIEKEDGTQTNIMEAETLCFGHFDGNEIECCICDDMKMCEEKTNKVLDVTKQRSSKTNEMEGEMNKETPKHKRPSCFKHFYDNCKQCDNTECIHRKECIESTKRTMPECFGDFDCKTECCQRCGSKK